MPKTIKGSSNIAVLDSKITVDLCGGRIYVDATPSTFIGAGADNLLGAKIKIENPFHVAFKDYDTAYDIAAPFTDMFSVGIPTQAGAYQIGTYTVYLQITDQGGITYEITKTVEVCELNKDNRRLKYGVVSAKLSGLCDQGKLNVLVDNVPTYKGLVSGSQEGTYTLIYPTGSELPKKTTSIRSFNTYLFEGVYKMEGEVCATYEDDESVFYKAKYILKAEKAIRCTIDECCVLTKLVELSQRLNEDCSDKEREETTLTTLDVLRLLTTAKLAAECGEDASDYILQLEEILGCSCSLVNEKTPLGKNSPSPDVILDGCGFEVEKVGLTTHYKIDNFSYRVDIDENGGALTASLPQQQEGCVMRQRITFDISKVYDQLKSTSDANTAESFFWSKVVNKMLDGLNISALGISTTTWRGLTFQERFQRVLDKIGSCCNCDAQIVTTNSSSSGDDVTLIWTSNNAYGVDVYIDGNYYDSVISPENTLRLDGLADGKRHEYTLVPKCSNGRFGAGLDSEFNYYGCPFVALPVLNATNVQNAVCPYNLTSLEHLPAPVGVTTEWHSLNNTDVSSLVPDPAAVGSGIYYAFSKLGNGCYSESVAVQVTCQTAECTAPQNMDGIVINGGFLIHFQSAAFPPPSNSYTVKRRLASAPDVTASYTVIGSTQSGINYNPTLGRWEVVDTTAQNNTDYVYIAISNCGATAPFTQTEFSNYPTCPMVTGLSVTINP